MNADDDGWGDEERDGLRSFLRQWPEPVAPPEIEEDLRRTFRRRRARRRSAWWLPLAAGLTLLLAGQIHRGGRSVPSIPTGDRPQVSATPGPLPTPSAPHRPGSEVVAPASTPPRRLAVSTAALAEPEVVVEPGQAELLVAFARRLPGVSEAESGGAMPRAEDLSAGVAVATALKVPEIAELRYQTEWETRTDGWTMAQRPAHSTGR